MKRRDLKLRLIPVDADRDPEEARAAAREPSFRARLFRERWQATRSALEAEGTLFHHALRFFVAERTVLGDRLYDLPVHVVGFTLREWLVFDARTGGHTGVERRLSEELVSDVERFILEDWRDSVLSFYRTVRALPHGGGFVLEDLFRGGEVRVEAAQFHGEDFGRVFALRVGRPRMNILSGCDFLPFHHRDGSARALARLERRYRRALEQDPALTRTDFLKRHGALVYQLWRREWSRYWARITQRADFEDLGITARPWLTVESGGGEVTPEEVEEGKERPDFESPCPCGSGSNYVLCCLARELQARIAPFLWDGPPPLDFSDRPDRWQIDLVGYPPTGTPALLGDDALLVVTARRESGPVIVSMAPLKASLTNARAFADRVRPVLLDAVDGEPRALPTIIETGHPEFVGALRSRLGDLDVTVRLGDYAKGDFASVERVALQLFGQYLE